MARNIIILNGCLRSSGNTMTLCEAFAQGARSARHTVKRFDIARFMQEAAQNQDLEKQQKAQQSLQGVQESYCQADTIVLASPLINDTLSAPLLTFLERLPKDEQEPKDCFLLMATSANKVEKVEPVMRFYKEMAASFAWTNLGVVLIGDVGKAEALKKRPELAIARSLAASLRSRRCQSLAQATLETESQDKLSHA